MFCVWAVLFLYKKFEGSQEIGMRQGTPIHMSSLPIPSKAKATFKDSCDK